MKGYFNDDESGLPIINEIKELSATTVPTPLPIDVKGGPRWDMVDEPSQRLKKTFKFEALFKLKAFLNEVLEYEEEMGHNGKITIEGVSVEIEVYTHRVNLVTELDIEYAKAVDEIMEDVVYFHERIPLE